jgi:predicted nucleotide-binding protein (sugar kinase/HSP70/actin superfamily)
MKAAFFLLGNTHIATKAFLQELGFLPVKLYPANKDIISKGVLLSPEFACFPFKVSLGILIRALDDGVELYIVPGNNSQAACQLSEFGRAQEHIIRKTGKKFEIFQMNTINPKILLEKFKKYNPKITLKQLLKAMFMGRQKAVLLELVEDCYRAIFLTEGKTAAENFKKKWLKKIDEAARVTEVLALNNKILYEYSAFKKLNTDDYLKIAVIGDIYCLNDSSVNNSIYDRILSMNVYVKQGISLSVMFESRIKVSLKDIMLERKAEKYLKHNVAGYAKNTIKDAIECAEEHYDGLIHLYPFNCMPEVTARNILPKIAKDYNIPILYLPIDEQTGDAGFTTRLEAFVDLLKMKTGKSK